MNWLSVRSTVKSLDDKDIASTLLDFFVWQYNQAHSDLIKTQYELRSFEAANKATEDTYKREYDDVGAWGPRLPYNSESIKYKEKELEEKSKNLTEAKAFLDFVKSKILDKAEFKK